MSGGYKSISNCPEVFIPHSEWTSAKVSVHVLLKRCINSDYWITYVPQFFSMRGISLLLPVKATFPSRSWICGAMPSLYRYRLKYITLGKSFHHTKVTIRTMKLFFYINTHGKEPQVMRNIMYLSIAFFNDCSSQLVIFFTCVTLAPQGGSVGSHHNQHYVTLPTGSSTCKFWSQQVDGWKPHKTFILLWYLISGDEL